MWVTQAACSQWLIINTEHPGEKSLWIIVASKYSLAAQCAAGWKRAVWRESYIKLVPAAGHRWSASFGCTYSPGGKAF